MEKKKLAKAEKIKKVQQLIKEDLYGILHPTGATYLGEGMYRNKNGNITEGKDLW